MKGIPESIIAAAIKGRCHRCSGGKWISSQIDREIRSFQQE